MNAVGRPLGPGTIRPPPVIQPVSAYSTLPVPRVAMNESIWREFDEHAVEQADHEPADRGPAAPPGARAAVLDQQPQATTWASPMP